MTLDNFIFLTIVTNGEYRYETKEVESEVENEKQDSNKSER